MNAGRNVSGLRSQTVARKITVWDPVRPLSFWGLLCGRIHHLPNISVANIFVDGLHDAKFHTKTLMPLDPYSLCPGGRDKKIRFCCPDMVKEIEQIERLLESNQGGSCLALIETLEKDHPDCACLAAAKLSVYRSENRWEDAKTLAKTFLEKEPENPVAAAEYALALAVTGEEKQGVSILIDAFERAKEGTAHSALINAALQVGACMLMHGFVLPVVALGNQLKRFPTAQEQANALLYQASSVAEMPLLLRDMIFDDVCPDSFPGKADYEDAVELVSLMRWKQALAKLESLTQFVDAWPAIWRNVAAVRLWLLDDEKGCEALQTYANHPGTPLEDAVDAEAARLFIKPGALGDETQLLFLEYPMTDGEAAYEKLLSTPRFYRVDIDGNIPSGEARPRCGFLLLDRPFPENVAELTLDSVASQIGSCLYYGKETDRPARLIVMDVLAEERAALEHFLKETLGDLIQAASETEEKARPISRTHAKVQYRFRYTPENMPSAETVNRLEKSYYDQFFAEDWSNTPLGLLDGKTPAAAAGEPAYMIRILAAIEMIEYWMNEELAIDFANFLRRKLQLPEQGPIAVPEGSEEAMLEILDQHPVWRWYRFEVEKLSTPVLGEGLQVVSVMKEPRATARFAKELLGRPMKDMPFPLRVHAFESLIGIEQALRNSEEALLWIEKAKNEAAELGFPDAGWCLHEIPIRLSLGQIEQAHDTINYLVKNYGKDDRVMQALQHLFVQLGLLNPDGTPSAAMQRRAEAATASPAASGGLWTPDTAAAPSDGDSKLWTPD